MSITVVGQRRNPGGEEFYHRHYETAHIIDILGISCRSFVSDLYPSYWDGADGDARARIKRMVPQLFNSLVSRPIKITVRLLDPRCPYVATRMEEEENNTAGCRRDILVAIDRIRCLHDDLAEAGQAMQAIPGSLEIRLIKKNPYVSIFRATGDAHATGDAPRCLLLGFITQGELADWCPALKVLPGVGDGVLVEDLGENILFDLAGRQLEKLESEVLFQWGNNSLFFREDRREFDVFLCYNKKDLADVRKIASDLRTKGVRCFFDEVELKPGMDFKKTLGDASQVCRGILWPQWDGSLAGGEGDPKCC